MGASSWVHVDVTEILRVTDKALLLEIDGDEVWVPRSQIADAEDYGVGDRDVTVSVTEWIAREKGLEGTE